jgi:formyltetrahydrofolate deformylase
MDWKITDSAVKKRVVVLVSKQEHCLYDLLRAGSRRSSTSRSLRDLQPRHLPRLRRVARHPLPPRAGEADNKAAAYAEVRACSSRRGDTMVLARYMQILSPELCAAYPGRILNIHHSFLPSFVGAKPYHQAYARASS